MPGYGYGFGMGWFGMLLVWLVPILILIAIINYFSNSSKSGSESKTPLEILEEVYARGEVSREDFLQRCDDLQQK